MHTQAADERLSELLTAFGVLCDGNDGLSILPEPPPADVDPGRQLTLRLVGAGSPVVTLRVRGDAADCRAVSGSDHAKAGQGEIRDQLGVALDDGFAWNDSTCASAGELAGLLLKHMKRRLKAVAEVAPES